MDSTTMRVAVCLDNNYVLPTAVLLNSIGSNKGTERIELYAVSEHQLSDESEGQLLSLLSPFRPYQLCESGTVLPQTAHRTIPNAINLISINPALGSPYRLYIQTIAFLRIDIK